MAKIVADCLVRADLRGVDTHGINRMPSYIQRLKAGVLNAIPALRLTQKSPVMASLDANNGFGFVAAYHAIDKAVTTAGKFGIGIVGVKNSNHFGMAANYLLGAMEKGFAAMVFTNAGRSMPVWGSKEPLLGTSPFAVGLPGGETGATGFVLDMSPSVVARVSGHYHAPLETCKADQWRSPKYGKQHDVAKAFLKAGCWMLTVTTPPIQWKR